MYCLADWVMVIWGIYPNDAIEETGFKDDLGTNKKQSKIFELLELIDGKSV